MDDLDEQWSSSDGEVEIYYKMSEDEEEVVGILSISVQTEFLIKEKRSTKHFSTVI